MNVWQETTLGNLTDWMSGGTPNKGTSKFWNGDIPWISANSMYGTRYSASDLMITKEGLENGSRLAPKGSILLLVRGGALHSKIPVGVAMREVAFNQDVKAIVAKENIDPWFLFSWFCAQTQFLLSNVVELTGIGAGKLDTDRLKNLPVFLPPLKEQKAIASIVKTLDDKIELNRRMNATLEAMARAFFKSWFVDFDPVRAKMEGKQPFGMDTETAALFPSRLVPSELGDIPEGWAVGTIKELCARVESGGTPSRSEPKYWQDGVVPWLTSGEVRQKIVMDTKEKISLKGLESSNAKLWPALSTVVAMYGATAGQVTLLGSQMAANQACCALIPSPYTQSFVYLKTSQSVSVYEGQATGSAQQNLNQTIVANLQTIIPIQNVLAAFENILVGHLFSMIQNTKESDSLAVMRDYLLPKLISGDIRIRDAEKFVEAA